MTLSESQRAVVEFLATTPDRTAVAHEAPAAPRLRSRPVADADTVVFLKTRAFAAAELHAVTFSTVEGRPWTFVVRTSPDGNAGYRVSSIGGGGGGPGDDPFRERPWVNLTAQWGSSWFRGGGKVIGQGAERARAARIRFADGAIVEDAVDNRVVLFETESGVTFPAEVQVIDETGALLSSYAEFEDFVSDGSSGR